MANGTIKQLPIKIDTPDVIESVSYSLSLSNFLDVTQYRLGELNINLTQNAQSQTGYKTLQVAFHRTRIVMYGQKTNDSWDTFGTIT